MQLIFRAKNKKNSNMVGMLEPSLMFSRAKIGFSSIQIKLKSVLYNTFNLKKLIFTNLVPRFQLPQALI